jgi:hypothetical protein
LHGHTIAIATWLQQQQWPLLANSSAEHAVCAELQPARGNNLSVCMCKCVLLQHSLVMATATAKKVKNARDMLLRQQSGSLLNALCSDGQDSTRSECMRLQVWAR